MYTHEEGALGHSIMDSKSGPVIRDVKGYVSKNTKAEMKTKSKKYDTYAQNPHNVINQKQIRDVMLQRLNTGKNRATNIVVWAITTVILLCFDSNKFLTIKNYFWLKTFHRVEFLRYVMADNGMIASVMGKLRLQMG